MRCPTCGAHNAESAEWCTQCYAPVGAAVAPRAPEPTPQPAPAPVPDAGDAGTVVRAEESGPTASDSRFRRTDEGIDWRCDVCSTWNPLERTTCVSCQTPFTRTIAPTEEAPRPEVNETAVVAASLLLPGAGHVMLGRTGAGVLRIILYVTWFTGGFLLLRAAAASGQGILPAVPLLLGALVVLGASVIEAQQATVENDLTILTPRVTLWLVVGVLGLLMMSFLAATVSAAQAS